MKPDNIQKSILKETKRHKITLDTNQLEILKWLLGNVLDGMCGDTRPDHGFNNLKADKESRNEISEIFGRICSVLRRNK